jgi:GWxTD domain-containing protein
LSRSRVCALFLLFAVSLTVWAGVSEKNLAPRYRHWLTVEVPYIIETEERNQFLALQTDAERDNFIRVFWESRNPTPGAEPNVFKEEHYRRLAYSNDHFGDPKNEDGWRTDQGRIYITLGAPQQIVTYPNAQNVRPLIVWFYSSPTPALPPFFSIVFYKRSTGDPYTLYSPYQDGPNRLVTGLEDENDQVRSLKTIQKSLGQEVARLTLSLLPSEPVDLTNYSPSMMSDSMLATIKGLPDNYVEKQRIANNRSRERVTSTILSTGNAPDVGYVVTRDEQGLSTVNMLVAFKDPDPSLIGQRKDKTLGYDLTLQTHIATEAGKVVYDQVDALTGAVGEGQAEVGRKKPFAAEGRYPLVPGTYILQSTLTNNISHEGHRFVQKVVVPETRASALGLSDPLVFSGNPARDEDDQLPFSFANLRFSPRALRTVTIHAGDRIPCVFQLWLPKETDGTLRKDPILMHYLYGSASLSGKPIDDSEETVDASNADSAGNLVTGHTFQTGDLAPGSYRMVIRATQAGSASAYSFLTIRVVPLDVPVGDWSVYGPSQAAHDNEKRELAAAALGHPAVAKAGSGSRQ